MIWKLNRIQDAGGESVGRSIRSQYLQVALDYGHQYQVLRNVRVDPIASNDVWTLINEAQKRFKPAQLVLFKELTLDQATDRQLVEIAICEMDKWYDRDRERIDCLSDTEYRLFKAIVSLFNLRFTPLYRFPERKAGELRIAWSDREEWWGEHNEWSRYRALCEI